MKDFAHIEVRNSPIHGRGVFALQHIPRRTRVVEYTGRRERWSLHKHKRSAHTEIFHISPTHILNPVEGGSIARYINHSCAPNCEAIQEEDRIFIYALRDIRPGEELFYDYGLILGRRFTREDVRLHLCRCGAPRCRGTMLAVPPHRRAQVRKWVAELRASPP